MAICAHRRPSSSCCRSRSGDTHTIRAKSSYALRATMSTHIAKTMQLRRHSPMLTPARRRSASFSTVLMFGPMHHEHQSAPRLRPAHCNQKKNAPIVAIMDVCVGGGEANHQRSILRTRAAETIRRARRARTHLAEKLGVLRGQRGRGGVEGRVPLEAGSDPIRRQKGSHGESGKGQGRSKEALSRVLLLDIFMWADLRGGQS